MNTVAVWPGKPVLRRPKVYSRLSSDAIVPLNNHYGEYSCIVKTPGTCGGEPRINGTRISVRVIADTHWQGASIETIADIYDLKLWQVEQAIDYANKNKETIKRLILENDRA